MLLVLGGGRVLISENESEDLTKGINTLAADALSAGGGTLNRRAFKEPFDCIRNIKSKRIHVFASEISKSRCALGKSD